MKAKIQQHPTMTPTLNQIFQIVYVISLLWNALNWEKVNVAFTVILTFFGIVYIMLKITEKAIDIWIKWNDRKNRDDSIH